MDVDALCEAATAATGLDDFGDPAFRAPLELFLRSGETDGRLTAIGDAALEGMALGNLVNRLRVVDWHSQNPAAGSTAVERPIFLIGLPRTGTTALSHLLSVDPDNRSLLNWEAVDSVPPPTRDWRNDPRFLAALEAPDMLDMINPEFKTIHHDPVDMPVECAVLLGQSFMSLHLTTTFNLPSYMDALFDLDHTPAYEYHRLVLQLLQSANPGRWQLKSPVHLVDPWALAATYPDARFVLTHRDPVQIVASVCSLLHRRRLERLDPHHVAGRDRNAPRQSESIPRRAHRGRTR
jgi:Sulfotransferase family